jgi:hypothetical protein
LAAGVCVVFDGWPFVVSDLVFLLPQQPPFWFCVGVTAPFVSECEEQPFVFVVDAGVMYGFGICPWNMGYISDGASKGAVPMFIPNGPYGVISGIVLNGVGVMAAPRIIFNWLASIRSKPVRSTDCLLLDPFLDVCFCTRNGVPVVPFVGLLGVVEPLE